MTSTNTPADTTAERRALLAVLLSRVERGVLLDAERALLRPLVEAEMAGGDKAEAVQAAAVGLRDAIAQALEAAGYRLDMQRGDLADAVMPVVLRRIEQIAAGRETWKGKAVEMEAALEEEAAAHEEHRRGMALILDLPVGADWLAVTRRVTEHRRELDAQLAARQRGDKP